MIIAGLQRTTLIDYPSKLACVIFLAVCNFRCPWCYSSELVLPIKIAKQPRISEKEIFDFLRQRRGLLEGVVICGGEPTVNKDLPRFLQKIKNLPASPSQGGGYFIKLDTNGSNPEMLKDLAKARLVDYVAMDIKASLNNPGYSNLLGDGATLEKIKESVEFLKNSLLDFEFRTTAVPGVHEKQDFIEIAKWIGGENVKYYLQNFFPQKTIDSEFEKVKPFPKEFLEETAKDISSYFKVCLVRS